ncbi:17072_t:CDS:1 [Dentiscutata erythropus]|uniref:17072_t:CDS:1 n=1 Tax=Dentiscutata erythropus TaxID=1348616 RepID=A0A9N9BG57_9GLOM|nr:17072_t:CDS:1 [Dentiscutata erythropus]
MPKETFDQSSLITNPTPFITTYSWKISNFRQLKENTCHGKHVYSPPFWNNYSGSWRLKLYPNGNSINDYSIKDYLSLYLEAIQTPYEQFHNISSRRIRFNFRLEKLDLVSSQPSKIFDLCNQNWFMNHEFQFDGDIDWGFTKFCYSNKIFQTEADKSKKIDLIFHVNIINDDNDQDNNEERNLYYTYTTGNEKFFEDPSFSDIEFELDCGTRIKAHKVILAGGSDYFEKMFKGGWKEKNTMCIKIHDISYKSFRGILFYIYTEKWMDITDLDLLKEMYAKADMMGLNRLKKMVSNKICGMLNTDNWDQIYAFGWEYGDSQFKISGFNFVADNWKAVRNSEKMIMLSENGNSELIEEIDSISHILGANFDGMMFCT